ncbi:unnamed protein product [Blepharisma stoltei]|uniref:Maturase K n=1 Tax=Blepharisma stoltei TaxID=1481888 RepID=A0AAU9IBW1_9CILI|nr:unnamed protein product [Blepharisma stoltei]
MEEVTLQIANLLFNKESYYLQFFIEEYGRDSQLLQSEFYLLFRSSDIGFTYLELEVLCKDFYSWIESEKIISFEVLTSWFNENNVYSFCSESDTLSHSIRNENESSGTSISVRLKDNLNSLWDAANKFKEISKNLEGCIIDFRVLSSHQKIDHLNVFQLKKENYEEDEGIYARQAICSSLATISNRSKNIKNQLEKLFMISAEDLYSSLSGVFIEI